MSNKRYAVHYFNNPLDDIDLLRVGRTEYFHSEQDAHEFVKQWTYKGKPFYWQPSIWVEEEVVTIKKEWREVKSNPNNQTKENEK